MKRRSRPSWRFALKRLREALATVDCAVIGHAKAKGDVGGCVGCGIMETGLRGSFTFNLEPGAVSPEVYRLLVGSVGGGAGAVCYPSVSSVRSRIVPMTDGPAAKVQPK